MSTYRVISEHLDGRHVRDFRSEARALAYADTITPDNDGSVLPNLPAETIAAVESTGWEYRQGLYWLGNRPAVIFIRRVADPADRDRTSA